MPTLVRGHGLIESLTARGDVVADVAQHFEDLGVGEVGREACSVDDLRHVCAREGPKELTCTGSRVRPRSVEERSIGPAGPRDRRGRTEDEPRRIGIDGGVADDGDRHAQCGVRRRHGCHS